MLKNLHYPAYISCVRELTRFNEKCASVCVTFAFSATGIIYAPHADRFHGYIGWCSEFGVMFEKCFSTSTEGG